METCIYPYVYLSISNIYLSVCMHVCMYVSIYLSVCLYTYIYLSFYFLSPPKKKNGREYKKYFLNFLSNPKVVKKSFFLIFSPKKR